MPDLAANLLLDYAYGERVNVVYTAVNSGGAVVALNSTVCSSKAACTTAMKALIAGYRLDGGKTDWTKYED